MDRAALDRVLREHFQWFHRRPELSYQEFETTARIRGILAEAGIEIVDAGLRTGVIARIPGRASGSGRVTALRADIDALPVTEETGLDYASEIPGRMHACGHDFHTTALIGAALLLRETPPEAGVVKLVFQSAEEEALGAALTLATGALDDVEEIYGLHVAPEYPSGVVALSPGATFAAVGQFTARLLGRGGHAAMPHLCVDPVPAAAALISQAQTIVSRDLSPFDRGVVSFTHVAAGTNWNVIPGEALLEGTVRALDTGRLEEMFGRLEALCRGLETGSGGALRVEFERKIHCGATNNDPALCEAVREVALGLGLRVEPFAPIMAGDDFALYQERCPGVYFSFGVGCPHGLHHPAFRADPAVLVDAARVLAGVGRAAALRGGRGPVS